MKRNDFEQELQGILQGFDQAPPASVWRRIALRLTFMQSLSSWIILGITTIGVISLGFLMSSDFETPEPPKSQLPDKLILYIDSTFHADGHISMDTVFQELPKLEEEKPKESKKTKLKVNTLEAVIAAELDSLFLLDTSRYNKGRDIFRNYCATCHNKNMISDLTGPALAGVTKKYEKEWLHDFTRNSQKMINEGDERAIAIWEQWKPTVMTNNYDLEDQELDDLYYYVEVKSMLD